MTRIVLRGLPLLLLPCLACTGGPPKNPAVKVELQLPVGGHANDTAFWAEWQNKPLLVVPDRDRRSAQERQEGEPGAQGVAHLETGQQATFSGTIEPVPPIEQMYSWHLTHADIAELARRGVYLRADVVRVP